MTVKNAVVMSVILPIVVAPIKPEKRKEIVEAQ
jgi:hypothetical protein